MNTFFGFLRFFAACMMVVCLAGCPPVQRLQGAWRWDGELDDFDQSSVSMQITDMNVLYRIVGVKTLPDYEVTMAATIELQGELCDVTDGDFTYTWTSSEVNLGVSGTVVNSVIRQYVADLEATMENQLQLVLNAEITQQYIMSDDLLVMLPGATTGGNDTSSGVIKDGTYR